MQGYFTPIKIVPFSSELFGLMQKEFAAVMDIRQHPRQHVSLLAEGFLVYEQTGFRDMQESVKNLDNLKPATAEKTKPQATDLDSIAERILSTFKSEEETLTDATLLAVSGVGRDRYTDVRDYLLYETEEISETAESIPTEYIRNWPRKIEAAA
jgi:hypothetical protein